MSGQMSSEAIVRDAALSTPLTACAKAHPRTSLVIEEGRHART